MIDITTLLVKSPHHRWDINAIIRKPACESQDGNDRTERTCLHCGMVKITVHPPQGFPWHEWRTATGAVWQGDSTPPCVRVTSPDPDMLAQSRPAAESHSPAQAQSHPLSTSSTGTEAM